MDVNLGILEGLENFASLLTTNEKLAYDSILPKVRDTTLIRLSRGHAQRVLRFLPFALMANRLTVFARAADQCDWGPRTIASYWGAVRAGMRCAGFDPSAQDREFGILVARNSRLAPTWDFESQEQFLHSTQVQTLAAMTLTALDRGMMNHVFPAYIALVWGQRVGDVLLLRTRNVFTVGDRVSVLFVEGKTAPQRGPWSLHAPRHSLLGRLLVWLAQASQSLFLFAATPQEVQRWERNIHATIPWKCDLRSLRRTGLAMLARTMSQEELLEVSRHASVMMLNLYLAGGLFNGANARTQTAAVSDVEASLNAPAVNRAMTLP